MQPSSSHLTGIYRERRLRGVPWDWNWPVFAFSFDASEENGCCFVVAALAAGEFGFCGDELAAERFGEDGLREFVGALGGSFDVFFNFVGELEKDLDAADDFVLLFHRRYRCGQSCYLSCTQRKKASRRHRCLHHAADSDWRIPIVV